MAARFFEDEPAIRAPAPMRAPTSPAAASGRTCSRASASATRRTSRYGLREHLAGKGVPLDLMIEVGLLVAGEDVAVALRPFPRPGDVPDHRPSRPHRRLRRAGAQRRCPGQVPELAGDAALPQGPLLYNPHDARKAAHDAGTVIVVEGYVDVIAMAVAGFRHTVAPLGTALTEDQLDLLWRMADEPILCFDGDKAGASAPPAAPSTSRCRILEPGRSLSFALLPDGQDPDDLIALRRRRGDRRRCWPRPVRSPR